MQPGTYTASQVFTAVCCMILQTEVGVDSEEVLKCQQLQSYIKTAFGQARCYSIKYKYNKYLTCMKES